MTHFLLDFLIWKSEQVERKTSSQAVPGIWVTPTEAQMWCVALYCAEVHGSRDSGDGSLNGLCDLVVLVPELL